eukprot:TRINITY_DN11832_c1_g1_i4.p1 TRINITY_DN11832_c1_g1~~TRINITY_DN11832_c1_g1_i4.p1  ORF type:complete len:290 (-),score=72.52 TRINITY_DN11832_c1_g1_i4:334-1203(-)
MLRVMNLMNLPTDFAGKGASTKRAQELTLQKVQAGEDLDALPIILSGLAANWTYGAEPRQVVLDFSGTVQISQGELVCIVGDHNSGKSTLLKHLAGVELRGRDEDIRSVFVPASVRQLLVPNRPMFLRDTMLRNLTLGLSPQEPAADPARVAEVCRMLEIGDDVIALLKSDVVLDWDESLSMSEMVLLSLARSIIIDYELLIIDTPLEHLNDEYSGVVMRALRDFVKLNGLGWPEKTEKSRPPSSCVVSAVRYDHVDLVDTVYAFGEGLEKVEKGDRGRCRTTSSFVNI